MSDPKPENVEQKASMMGAPRKEVDWPEFDKLCAIQCTQLEIADWFDMGTDTLNTRCKEKYSLTFSALFAKKRAGGKISLRRDQWQSSQKGNVTMQIWLGKQYLGQSDKNENKEVSEIHIKIDKDDALL